MERISYPKNIQIFFDEVVDLIKASLDPDFIIIAGSFGKGSWLFHNKKLISDFEIIFICDKKWSNLKKKQLVKKLNKKYPYDIELKGFFKDKIEHKLLSNYASSPTGYINLNFFDAFNEPQYLYQKNDRLLDIKTSVLEIPHWEVWRLYVNRMGDILKIACNSNFDQATSQYFWLKIFESTADAYCIINNIYDKNISKRLVMFNKKLIDTDTELSDTCKNSFPVIQKALQARKDHDLSIFNMDMGMDDSYYIINEWMLYIERKVANQENILSEDRSDFISNYVKNKPLQRKYLDFNNGCDIVLANIMKLIKNLKKLKYPFKYYVHNYSWRHIILLSVSSAFYEQSMGSIDFTETKKITGKIINMKELGNLKNGEFVKTLLKYWKVIR